MRPCERGVTLAELLVVLVVLGLVASSAGLVARAGDPQSTQDPASQLAVARREALMSGRAVRITFLVDGRLIDATAWPDGSIQSDTILPIEPLSGRIRGPR